MNNKLRGDVELTPIIVPKWLCDKILADGHTSVKGGLLKLAKQHYNKTKQQ